jgi:hypothetical protein
MLDSRQDSLDGESARCKAATYTGQHKHRINADIHALSPWVGFELTISAFEGAKTVHALDRAVTVTGTQLVTALHKSL